MGIGNSRFGADAGGAKKYPVIRDKYVPNAKVAFEVDSAAFLDLLIGRLWLEANTVPDIYTFLGLRSSSDSPNWLLN